MKKNILFLISFLIIGTSFSQTEKKELSLNDDNELPLSDELSEERDYDELNMDKDLIKKGIELNVKQR